MVSKRSTFIVLIFIIPFVVGVAIVGYWFYTTRVEKRSLLPNFGTVPSFSLTTEGHRLFNRGDLIGKISIVDFIFTSCAGACPIMSTKMTELQEELKQDSLLQFISFSVDPETDTPDVLASYGHGYGAIPGKWIFLTGSKDSIYTLTKQGFHLGLDIEGEDAIIHSQKFVLVDHHGNIRGYYDSDDNEAMKTLRRDTHILSGKVAPR